MRPSRSATLVLLLLACQSEPAVYVQLVAAPTVPALDRLHVMVLQNGELLQQDRADFSLSGVKLPQTVLISSRADTATSVDIVAQGFSGSFVKGRGEVTAMLGRDKPYQEVTLVLLQPCTGTDCALTPTTCDAQHALCGTVDDLAGGFLDCGRCTGGQTCGGGGPHRCGAAACKPTASCASLDAGCGYVFDGCGMVPCGGCPAQQQCTLQRSCACSPTVSCATADAGCSTIDDGCGHPITCAPCAPPAFCAPDGRCSCTPDCSGRACGADDGCNGVCQTGACADMAQVCVQGACKCPSGSSNCSGTCADLLHDAKNCGACGNVCPNGRACANGVCMCNEPSDNADGHCCPPGLELAYAVGSTAVYCFSQSPHMPATLDTAEMICAAQGACVGIGPPGPITPAPVPETAMCSAYLDGRVGLSGADPSQSWVETYTGQNGMLDAIGGGACTSCDGGASCTCDCFCGSPAVGCVQPYYCVTDPLGPRKDPCSSSSDCQAGTYCDAGTCTSAPMGSCCVGAYFCAGAGSGKACHPLGAGRATGVCR